MLVCLCVCVVLQVRSFIDDAYKRTVAVLREKKDLVENMAQVQCCCAGLCCARVCCR